jgi:hypothetical protein
MAGKKDKLADDTEIERRRDAALLRALSTPHKRQAEMKIGKRKPQSDENPRKHGETKHREN